jgi:predicted pyridoxine 5'-phosphate oxidase superfamily flavin-nucleotide-binding protein
MGIERTSDESAAEESNSTSDVIDARADRPGSTGEHILQEQLGTVGRAEGFYENAMQESLTDRMVSFLTERRMGFVSGVDGGRPVTTPCIGDPGVVRVLGPDRIAWPRAALVDESPSLVAAGDEQSLSLVAIDWWETTVGLHVNGVGHRQRAAPASVDYDGPPTEWYVLDIEEAYIHCAKHIPQLSLDEDVDGPTADTVEYAGHDRLVPSVREFIDSQLLAFLATADGAGETDISPRLGPEGFVQVLDEETLAWPEYRGNGVHASLGNIAESQVASLLFVDFWHSEAMVEVTGTATLHESVDGATDLTDADRTKQWVRLEVAEVSVATDPPLPALSVAAFDPPWGTDDERVKKTGFFDDG